MMLCEVETEARHQNRTLCDSKFMRCSEWINLWRQVDFVVARGGSDG
jgi:hypothetical protein